MMNKLVDTLEQFLREIIAAQEMFDRCKVNPPLTRNQPPVAGRQGTQRGTQRAVCMEQSMLHHSVETRHVRQHMQLSTNPYCSRAARMQVPIQNVYISDSVSTWACRPPNPAA